MSCKVPIRFLYGAYTVSIHKEPGCLKLALSFFCWDNRQYIVRREIHRRGFGLWPLYSVLVRNGCFIAANI